MTADDIERMALQDLSIDMTHFDDFVRSLGEKRIKWAKILYEEQRLSAVAEEKLKEIYRRRFKYYLYDDPLKIDKKNIDIFVNGDDEYRTAEKIYKQQKAKENIIDQVLKAIDQQSFNCNNILKYMMYQAGVSF